MKKIFLLSLALAIIAISACIENYNNNKTAKEEAVVIGNDTTINEITPVEKEETFELLPVGHSAPDYPKKTYKGECLPGTNGEDCVPPYYEVAMSRNDGLCNTIVEALSRSKIREEAKEDEREKAAEKKHGDRKGIYYTRPPFIGANAIDYEKYPPFLEWQVLVPDEIKEDVERAKKNTQGLALWINKEPRLRICFERGLRCPLWIKAPIFNDGNEFYIINPAVIAYGEVRDPSLLYGTSLTTITREYKFENYVYNFAKHLDFYSDLDGQVIINCKKHDIKYKNYQNVCLQYMECAFPLLPENLLNDPVWKRRIFISGVRSLINYNDNIFEMLFSKSNQIAYVTQYTQCSTKGCSVEDVCYISLTDHPYRHGEKFKNNDFVHQSKPCTETNTSKSEISNSKEK